MEMKTSNVNTTPALNTPQNPFLYIQDVISIPLLLQLLEQVATQQYETKALANNKVKVQPATTDAYRAIIKALAEKNTEFHTYKPKEERSYRM
jgi:2-methylisocitrate lyase-like PEP mutase family enzyme